MNKAVFLDRDGVVNDGTLYYTYKAEDFILNKGVLEALKLLQNKSYLLFVITNQGGVAKKMYTKADVENVHTYMLNQFEKANIHIEEVYYCPHHSDVENCLCRKPNSLLIEKAIAQFNIDSSQSYFIGDRETDILAGKKAGLKTLKIDLNEDLKQVCSQILKNG